MNSIAWCTVIIVSFLLIVSAHDQRERRVLTYHQHPEGLNIDHIISLWNRSVSEDVTTTSTTRQPPSKQKYQKNKIADNFADRLTFCVKKQKLTSKAYPDQGIILRCLKEELISKLHSILSHPDENIKLFNGYMEFQKLQQTLVEDEVRNETKKKYSSRVSSKITKEPEQNLIPVPLKQPKSNANQNNYYEAYQKMLKELVPKNDDRRKRDIQVGTLEKSAKLFESGRKLISEISNNLENGQEEVETLTDTILDPDLVASINNFTKTYALRLNFYPGISARMKRNDNSGVTFDLELDDLHESEDDNETSHDDDGGRGGKKKKKKKISKKTLKKLFPYLLIPFMIQAALLPIVLKFLLFVAIKALIAGKLALILVAFNAIRNASLKSDEDEYIERMSYDHYGYGNGEEYGAWINRRSSVNHGPPEGQKKQEEEEEEEYAEPYRAYRPQQEVRD